MKKKDKIFDKIRITYEMDLPVPLSLEGAMAWIKVLEEQVRAQQVKGQKIVNITAIERGKTI